MEATEFLEIVARVEDNKHQLKANVTNRLSLAQEIVAFSNSGGGALFIGVNDAGTFSGLERKDMERLSNLVSNTASQQVSSPPRQSANPSYFHIGRVGYADCRIQWRQ